MFDLHLVFLPQDNHIGVSQKIPLEQRENLRLRLIQLAQAIALSDPFHSHLVQVLMPRVQQSLLVELLPSVLLEKVRNLLIQVRLKYPRFHNLVKQRLDVALECSLIQYR